MRPLCWMGVVALLAAGWSACATYSQYRCPDPIGEIVRQDCDDYKVRYESLQASLSVSFGSFSIGGSVGQEQLRDPSELIQVMMQQTLALCHDYNACRVPSTDFSRRREQMDRTFTAVMAILDQLKAPGLSDGERQSLLRELIAILKGPAAPDVASPQPSKPAKPPAPVFTRNPFQRETGWWLGSKHLPPQPPREPDVPVVIGLDVHESRREPMQGFTVELWGQIPEDDDLWAEGPAGFRLRCKISRKRDEPLATGRCRPERGDEMPQLDRFRLTYTIGARAESVTLAEVDLRDTLHVRHGWLAFQPEPVEQVPIVRERPYLAVFTSARAEQALTARCWHDGKPLTSGTSAVLKGSRHSNPYVRFQTYVIGLPFVVDYGDLRAAPAEDPPFSKAAGQWRCQIKLGAEALREVRFTVSAEGAVEPHPDQGGKPGQVASPWWLLETRVLPNSLEPGLNAS